MPPEQRITAADAEEFRRKLLAAIHELDRAYDGDYVWCCDAGSDLGAARAIGKRMALNDLRRLLSRGEDMSDLNELLLKLRAARPAKT